MELLGEEGVKNLPVILDQMVNDLDEIKAALI